MRQDMIDHAVDARNILDKFPVIAKEIARLRAEEFGVTGLSAFFYRRREAKRIERLYDEFKKTAIVNGVIAGATQTSPEDPYVALMRLVERNDGKKPESPELQLVKAGKDIIDDFDFHARRLAREDARDQKIRNGLSPEVFVPLRAAMLTAELKKDFENAVIRTCEAIRTGMEKPMPAEFLLSYVHTQFRIRENESLQHNAR